MKIGHGFMDKPIPDLSTLRINKSKYRHYPIRPISEICVELNPEFCHSYYWHYDPRPVGAMEKIFLRRTLSVKLNRINQNLLCFDLRLLIQEGYRPLSVQKFVQEVSVLKGLKKENPNLGEDVLRERAKLFAASTNEDLQTSPPPHLTGGAVDLTLVYNKSALQVDMGKSGGLYNTAFPDAFESMINEDAKRYRRLLYWLAHEEGMVMNPTEWWHLSWGDQMWAWATNSEYAVYGVAENFKQLASL